MQQQPNLFPRMQLKFSDLCAHAARQAGGSSGAHRSLLPRGLQMFCRKKQGSGEPAIRSTPLSLNPLNPPATCPSPIHPDTAPLLFFPSHSPPFQIAPLWRTGDISLCGWTAHPSCGGNPGEPNLRPKILPDKIFDKFHWYLGGFTLRLKSHNCVRVNSEQSPWISLFEGVSQPPPNITDYLKLVKLSSLVAFSLAIAKCVS